MTCFKFPTSKLPIPSIIISIFAVLRLPTPGKEPADLEHYKGSPGFAAQIMYDVQRVFACLDVQAAESIPGRVLNEDYIIKVAQAAPKFSAKVTLPMTANSEWRSSPQLFRSID